jgi:hypothetical protein
MKHLKLFESDSKEYLKDSGWVDWFDQWNGLMDFLTHRKYIS